MPVLRSAVLLDAPPRTVAGLLRDSGVLAACWRTAGHRVGAAARLLSVGHELRAAVRPAPGVRVSLRLVVESVSERGMVLADAGPNGGRLRNAVTLTPSGTGTLLLDELVWCAPGGPVADLVLRAVARRTLAARAAVLTERVQALAGVPVVVATALVRDGRLLAAQRTRPPELAGRWELPGGRVEPGESEPDAVARECREELGAVVRATGRLGTDLPIDAGLLRVHAAELVDGSPEPLALEHAALRWLPGADLPALGWVEADRAVLPELLALLQAPRSRS